MLRIIRFGFLSLLGLAGTATAGNILNEQMSEVAAFYAGRIKGDHDVLLVKQLDRTKLDLTVGSLHAVDSWLGQLRDAGVRADNELAGESVIWAGAYVGEVLRRCAKRDYAWMHYDEYMAGQQDSLRTVFPMTFSTQFLLVSGKGFTLPINKVVRYLEEGPENSVHFYVAAECGDG